MGFFPAGLREEQVSRKRARLKEATLDLARVLHELELSVQSL